MYVIPNFQSAKALKKAVMSGERVTVFEAGPFARGMPASGSGCAEGPHYPEPHRWYAGITYENGVVTSVK